MTNRLFDEAVPHCPNPTCLSPFEKTDACNQMSCSFCDTIYCFLCGKEHSVNVSRYLTNLGRFALPSWRIFGGQCEAVTAESVAKGTVQGEYSLSSANHTLTSLSQIDQYLFDPTASRHTPMRCPPYLSE